MSSVIIERRTIAASNRRREAHIRIGEIRCQWDNGGGTAWYYWQDGAPNPCLTPYKCAAAAIRALRRRYFNS